jgi:uncharacterized phage protein (TIGR01671 family)
MQMRAYLKSESLLADVISIDFEDKSSCIHCDEKPYYQTVNFDDLIFLHCSDLKDANGNMIYEGDIMAVSDSVIGLKKKAIVKYGEFKRTGDSEKEFGFYLFIKKDHYLRKDLYYWTEREHCEIIGSTYNKEAERK